MKKVMRTLVLAGMALAGVSGWAGPQTGNCRSTAEIVTPQASDRTGTLLREWSETYGEWYDGGEDDAPAQDQFASYWMKVSLTRGLDYVISADVSTGTSLSIQSAETNMSYASVFSGNSVQVGNRIYRYVRAKDWKSFDAVNYHVRLVGGYGAVGRPYAVAVQQRSITDVIPDPPGSDGCPIALDVSENGHVVIAEPPNGGRTVYSATFRANEPYVFTGVAPSPGKNVLVTLSEDDWAHFPGTAVVDQSAHTLTVSVTRDYAAKLWVMADDWSLSWSVAGGTLEWTAGLPPVVGRGSLKDSDTGAQTATFDIVATRRAGVLSASGTVTVAGVSFVYRANGNGEMVGETIVGGVPYPSYFSVSCREDGVLAVDGSMTLDASGPREFFFAGNLGDGAYVVRYDPGVGSGTMSEQACDWGKVYKLGDCRFTAPAGMRFAGWHCDGRRYDPGMLFFNLAGEAGTPRLFTALWVPVE